MTQTTDTRTVVADALDALANESHGADPDDIDMILAGIVPGMGETRRREFWADYLDTWQILNGVRCRTVDAGRELYESVSSVAAQDQAEQEWSDQLRDLTERAARFASGVSCVDTVDSRTARAAVR